MHAPPPAGTRSRYRAVCFDLDGTLLPGTSVSLWLAEKMGQGAVLAELEARFRAGEISNSVIADASAGWLAGIPVRDIWGMLGAARWIEGIQETVDGLKASGMKVLLGTITWRMAAEFLGDRHGFDAVSGTEMGIEEGVLTGRVTRHFDEYDKRQFVADYCRSQGFSLSECVAIGDSRSDIPLFRQVGLAIAFNGTADAQQAAHVCSGGDDIRSVLPAIVGS
jgi:phosphoserine phosphatase